MSLTHRVLTVIRGSLSPVSAGEIGYILGMPAPRITASISKLCSYGEIENAGSARRKGRPQCRYYRMRFIEGAP